MSEATEIMPTAEPTAENSSCLSTVLWIVLGIVVVACVANFVMQRRKCSVSLSQQETAEEVEPTGLASLNDGMVCTMYYASWCPHCKGMMDDMDALARSMDNIRFAKVNAGDGNKDVQAFCEGNGITITGFPHFVCAQDGNIKWQDAGARNMDSLLDSVKTAFNLS